MASVIRYRDPRGRYDYTHYHFTAGVLRISNIVHLVRVRNTQASDAVAPHRNNDREIELHYIAAGTQQYTVGGDDYFLQPGDVLVVRPGEQHHGGLCEEKRIGYYLFIDIEAHPDNFLGLGTSAEVLRKTLCGLPRVIRAGTSITGIFDDIIRVYERGERSHLPSIALASLYLKLLSALSSPHAAQPPVHEKIAAAMSFIDGNVRETISVNDMARQAHLSSTELAHRFRRDTGMSPKEYLIRKRIMTALKLLTKGTMSITDIAHELQFASGQHFATAFRSYTNMTPRQYRSAHMRSAKAT